MSWLETSIMARRGLAKGKPGKTYSITEESRASITTSTVRLRNLC